MDIGTVAKGLGLIAGGPVGAAIELASLVPSFLKMFGQDQPAQAVEKAVDIAKTLTGAKDPEEALAALKANDELMQKYKDAAEARSVEVIKTYIEDTQNARAHDTAITQIKGSNKRGDYIVLLTVLGIVALIVCAVGISDLSEFAKGIINISIGVFLGNWQQINNFEFGTSRASKVKDQTISDLTGSTAAAEPKPK